MHKEILVLTGDALRKAVAVLDDGDDHFLSHLLAQVTDQGYGGKVVGTMELDGARVLVEDYDHTVAIREDSLTLYRRTMTLEPTGQVKAGHCFESFGETITPDDEVETIVCDMPTSIGISETRATAAHHAVVVMETMDDAAAIGLNRLRFNAFLQTGSGFEPLVGDDLDSVFEESVFDFLMNEGKLSDILAPLREELFTALENGRIDLLDNGEDSLLSFLRRKWFLAVRGYLLALPERYADRDFADYVAEETGKSVREGLAQACRKPAWAMFHHYCVEAKLAFFDKAVVPVSTEYPVAAARALMALARTAKLAGAKIPPAAQWFLDKVDGKE